MLVCHTGFVATRTTTGIYGGIPADERRAERRLRLLDAGLEVLGTEGWQATTVRAICKQARLNARYFYESFSGLDELLVAVFDRIVADAVEAVLAALSQAPQTAQDQARAAVSTFVTSTTDDPRKARVAFVEALGSEALMRRRFDALQDFANLVAAYALQFHASEGLDEKAAAVNAHVLSGGLLEAIVAWLEGRLDVTRDQLVDHCTALFVAGSGVSTT
jgi:AcrR family transcriptional regulator